MNIEIGKLYTITDAIKNRQGNLPLCKVLKINKDDTCEVEAYGMIGPGDETIIKGVPIKVLEAYMSNIEPVGVVKG